MGRKRGGKSNVPRVKRMKRSARLQSAVSWLKQFEGKHVLRSYCKRFGVDWRCAAIELRQLGVQLDAEYLTRREEAERQLVNERRQRREAHARKDSKPSPFEYESIFGAYLARDFEAMYAMECERDGIDPAVG